MAGPPPPDDPTITLSKFLGIKNSATRERLQPGELESAINVDIDDDGQVHRRRGYRQMLSGNFHSLFTAQNGVVYAVGEGELGIVNPNFTFTSLGQAIGNDPATGALGLAYVQVGPTIYFSCPSSAGQIYTTTNLVSEWGPAQPFWLSPVVNPTATLPAIRGKMLAAPPNASFLAYFNGRIYLGVGSTVWATELYLYNFVDQTKGFIQFEADVTMIGSVGDGVYVGTKEGLWFLSGTFGAMKRTRVMDSPVIPGSMAPIPGELGNPPQVGLQADTPMKVSIAFQTASGYCVASDGGEAYNMTESKFNFPITERAAAFFRRQDGMNQYIAVNDSEGGPTNNARIGDYVDATIVRFNGGA